MKNITKKLIVVALILILILPTFAFANDFVGVWVSNQILTDDAPCMSYLYLAEDHTCYFVTQMFHPDKAGLGRQFVGSWELLPSGYVYAKIGNNSSATLSVYGDFALDETTGDIYTHVYTLTLNDLV